MEVSLSIEGLPQNHKPYIVARLVRGRLLYYDSYLSKERAETTVDRLETALVVKGDL